MKGVILVGGEGTRLRPLTSRLPKPIVPIVNEPFLVRMIQWIRGYGITDIVLALCYLPDRIRDRLGDGSQYGVSLTYVVEDSPLGTAGAVKNAAGHITDTCFVFNGDILTDLDLGAMLETHRRTGAKVSISLTPVEDPSQFGVVETDDTGRIHRFTEKPKREEAASNWINAGTYILDPDVLDLVPADTFWMFERNLFPDLLANGARLQAFPSECYWIDLGTPGKYRDAHNDLLSGRVTLGGETRIAGDARIDPAATLIQPVVIGSETCIDAGATVGPNVVIGAGCQVRGKSTIANAILWDGVVVDDASIDGAILADGVHVTGSNVGDAILGSDVRVGPGNRLAHGIRIFPGTVLDETAITFG